MINALKKCFMGLFIVVKSESLGEIKYRYELINNIREQGILGTNAGKQQS
jgi:hypothetical protein